MSNVKLRDRQLRKRFELPGFLDFILAARLDALGS
jgi:hypothetical protein